MSFNLLDRPWLPVLTRDGQSRISLRNALDDAHEVSLAGRPEEHTALLRLLLAVYAAAARPADADQWDAAWRSSALDTRRIGGYLDAHADRFDLFCATHPFWQSADVTAANRGVDVLEIESWGSGTAQFAAHLLMPPEPMDPADAAVRLVLLQSWHPGGIQSGHPADPATRSGKVYGGKPAPLSTVTHLRITGACLKDELLLNCPPGTRTPQDRPVWERGSPPAPMLLREPAGVLDVWTWPTRRIRLLQDESGHVSAVALHDGDRAADPGAAAARWDPGAATNGRGTRLATVDAARHLLPWAPARLLDGGPETGSCAVLGHLLAAAERGVLPPETRMETVVLRAEHTTAHRAALSGILPVRAALGPVGVLADPGRRAAFVAAAGLPWELQRQVSRTAAETLSLMPTAAPTRPGLSLAAHLGHAWEEFSQDPDQGADRWAEALATAVEQVAGCAGNDLMAAARIRSAALRALPRPGLPVPGPATEEARP
ncbi:type I-E CRISPR-associated protein Cse1/CasA [Streptomyces sp. NBC_01433]|uniref:type I-E CRISPR-associated protein Cse1/CasA n=1 Tax=Streptomyces sp. NBC_01433 TaxID=2903864 RepID=UPI0022509B77|nr:type I-E CRISPR-associated protein Cse1/CasA [Streptomyces sp. NBC_01433]MCX4681566.1 type I-E CRISPR-associated protein Cse1/CasA [Streptomyces sp. NBC_01433]